MKRLLLTISLCMPFALHAEPSSKIAWTPETLKHVKTADATNGKVLAKACKSCHGDNGQGMPAETQDDETIPAIPAIAGQLATYTYKQLRDYFNDSRTDSSMTLLAKTLSDQDAADLAAWFAALPAPQNKAAGKMAERAEKMVAQGDGKRILPPCSVCHGSRGQGEKMDVPALAGQHASYFVRTLMAYKNGERHNDVYSRMRLIAQQLSDEEIKELAQYYWLLK